MADTKKISFFGSGYYAAGFRHLIDALDEYVRNHDHDLAQDAAAARTDLAVGTAVAEWLAGAVFCSAERLFAGQTPVSLAGGTFAAG
jgi:hypothetical protein